MKARYVYHSLNETYESFRELQSAVKIILESLEDLKGENPIPISSIFKEKDLSSFPTLKNFLSSNVGIIYDKEAKDSAFVFPSLGGKDEEGDRFQSKDWPWGVIVIKNERSILHELQHAYDYFRSNRKMLSDKKIGKYSKLLDKREWDPEDPEILKSYARLDTEKSAFLSDVINYLRNEVFGDREVDKLPDAKRAYLWFKMAYPAWDQLKTADQKKLAKRFYVYWTKILKGD